MTGRPLRATHAAVFSAFLIAWTAALLSPVPHEDAERVLGGDTQVFIFGKALHISAYLFLATLGGTIAWLRGCWRWLLAGLIAHGGITEFLQRYTGRNSTLRDFLLDTIGVLIGAFIVRAWWSRRGRQETGIASEASRGEPGA